jgi:uncharacterized protein (DUF169 family)
MATLPKLNSYGEELEKRLRLKTLPLAIKLLENERDIPDGAIRPKRDLGYHLALCQGFASSRREGTLMAMLKEDMWCSSPVIALGIAEAPEYYLEGHTYFPVTASTLEVAKNLANTLPRLEYGKCIGVASAPLKTANFEPDLVMIYCDSAQLKSLLSGIKYKEGERVTSTLDPSGACIQSTVPVVENGKCQVAVPCGGDRRWALAQDDEIIFSAPRGKLEDLMLGLRHLDEVGVGLPVNFGARIEYYVDENHLKVARMLGMDVPD